MGECEYLVGYGLSGEFGRFRPVAPLSCGRGDRVVVRTHRGIEAGHVLRAAAPGHARFLPNTSVGQLLRPFGPADADAETVLRPRGCAVWERANELADELGLRLEVLDVEVLLDGEHAVLHHLRAGGCDVRPFVSTLAREFGLHVLLEDLNGAGGAAFVDEPDEGGHGCGDCGSRGGGCGSCGGGACGSCAGSGAAGNADFAALREQTERQRTSLL
jgi:hypothetical protein